MCSPVVALASHFAFPLAVASLGDPSPGAVVSRFAEVAHAYPVSALAASLRVELESLIFDCAQPGWDGYGAEAVGRDAYQAAMRFIGCLPPGTPAPEIGADPDGCISFEWRKSPRRTLLVSVRPSYALDYAALIGMEKAHGSAPFFGELPDAVQMLIRRVMAA